MTDGEAVLLRVRAAARTGGGPGVEIAVAALADVPVATLAAALSRLDGLDGLAAPGRSCAATTNETWVLAPDDRCPAWPPDATLRTLGVLDGTPIVLRLDSGGVSAARS